MKLKDFIVLKCPNCQERTLIPKILMEDNECEPMCPNCGNEREILCIDKFNDEEFSEMLYMFLEDINRHGMTHLGYKLSYALNKSMENLIASDEEKETIKNEFFQEFIKTFFNEDGSINNKKP